MTITATMYGGFLEALANKEIDLNTDALKVMLLGQGYTPSDTHRYVSDLGSNEITGTGYTAGGQALNAVTATYSGGKLVLDAENSSWANSTITAYYAVVYDSTPGSAATNPVISYVNFGGAESDTNGTFQITWAAGGIAYIEIG